MYYNLYYLIIKKLPIASYKNFAIINYTAHQVTLDRIDAIKRAVKKIDSWWDRNKLPLDIETYNHMRHCEFLINFRYYQSRYAIPKLANSDNVWLMLRYFRGTYYIQFNRNEDNVHNHRGFIIGKTDYSQKFYKLKKQEFLICLKRYQSAVDPETNIIWLYENNRRSPIGRIDEYYNIEKI